MQSQPAFLLLIVLIILIIVVYPLELLVLPKLRFSSCISMKDGWRERTLLMASTGDEPVDVKELRELVLLDEAEDARRKDVRMPAGEKRERMAWKRWWRSGTCKRWSPAWRRTCLPLWRKRKSYRRSSPSEGMSADPNTGPDVRADLPPLRFGGGFFMEGGGSPERVPSYKPRVAPGERGGNPPVLIPRFSPGPVTVR